MCSRQEILNCNHFNHGSNNGDTLNTILTRTECIKAAESALNLPSNEFELIDYELIPTTKEIIGFLGDYFYLNITVKKLKSKDEKIVINLFVKVIPPEGSDRSKYIRELKVFEKEATLYTCVLQKMDKFNPMEKWHGKCVYVRNDIIVMENLQKQGYQHSQNELCYSVSEVRCVLRTIARMHANSIAFENKTGLIIGDLCKSLHKEITVLPDCSWFLAGLKALKPIAVKYSIFHRDILEEFFRTDGTFDEYIEETYRRVNSLTPKEQKYRFVFCHRDLWDKNLLFKYSSKSSCTTNKNNNEEDPENCIILDYQICRYLPPIVDVLMFIYINTSVDMRSKFLPNFLRYYYQHLQDASKCMGVNLNKEIPWDQFQESYRYCELILVVLNGIFTPAVKLPDGIMNELKVKDPEKYHYYIICDRTDLILEQMEKHSNYRKQVTETVDDIINYMISLKKKAKRFVIDYNLYK